MKSDVTTTVVEHAVGMIDASPFQVRKRFREEGIEELAASVREHGVIQPLVARPSPRDAGRLELVAGERRLRAAQLAGIAVVPVMVREMSDETAQEIVLIENLQREDLTVSEEADGYWQALQLTGPDGAVLYTQERLAARISKPVDHIRRALKMRMAPRVLLEAVDAGEVAASVAVLIGRIPDERAREKAAAAVLRPDYQQVPLNFVQTKELVRERFMVALTGCGFDTKDAGLVPVAFDGAGARESGGACTDCPFRSGNCEDEEELASAGSGNGRKAGVDPNLCTLPACFKRKQDAAWRLEKAQAEREGLKVVEGKEAERVFGGWNGAIAHDAGYVDLDAKPEYGEVGDVCYDNAKKYRSLLKGAEGVEVVRARNPHTGKVVDLVKRETATAIARSVLRGRPIDAAEADRVAAADESKRKEARAKELRDKRVEESLVMEGLNEILEGVNRRGLEVEDWRYVFEMALDGSGADGMQLMAQWLEIPKIKGASSGREYEEAIIEHVKARAEVPQAVWGFLVVALMAGRVRWHGRRADDWQHWLERFGVKVADLERRAEALNPVKVKKGKGEAGDEPKEERIDMEKIEDVTAAADALHRLPMAADAADGMADATPPLREWPVDEDPAGWPVEKQAAALHAGTHQLADFIGKKPGKDEVDELRGWSAARMRLKRAVRKLEA